MFIFELQPTTTNVKHEQIHIYLFQIKLDMFYSSTTHRTFYIERFTIKMFKQNEIIL